MPLQLYKIASNDLTTTASTVTFSNIPQGYTDLKIAVSARNTLTGGGNWSDFLIKYNSATTTYTQRYVFGNGSTASSGTGGYSAGYGGNIPTADTTANTFGNIEIYIPNYRSSNQKSFSFDSVTENNATSAIAMLGASLWNGTSAITSIELSSANGSLVANSTFTLYGIL